jgi:RNA polymerase sigma-70 factor (ECF subfamily)
MQHIPNDPDHELVELAQNGDTRAFDTLIEKHQTRLYGLVHHMTSHHEDSHDILQEVYSRAFRSIRSFRGHSSFHTWIHQIAVNHTLNFLRKKKRRSGICLHEIVANDGSDPALVDPSHQVNPERQTIVRELRGRLNEAIKKLTDAHRRVVMMFDLQGMSHGEIARKLNTSEGTIRSRLHYAHLQLQSALQDTWNERICD